METVKNVAVIPAELSKLIKAFQYAIQIMEIVSVNLTLLAETVTNVKMDIGISFLAMDVRIVIATQLEATIHHAIRTQENAIASQELLAKNVTSVHWHTTDFQQKAANHVTAIQVDQRDPNVINLASVPAMIMSKEDGVIVAKRTSLIAIKVVWIALLVTISSRKQQMNIEENWQI